MLYIHFGPLFNGKELFNPDDYFNDELYSNPHLVDDDFAREVLMDVEGTKVIGNYVIDTEYLGVQPSQKICGGVKAILLMKNCPEVVVDATNCGDNCAKWIQKLGREQDVTITMYVCMEFKDPFEAVCLNSGKKLNSFEEYEDAYFDWYKFDRKRMLEQLYASAEEEN